MAKVTEDDIKLMIKQHEGYRDRVYKCTADVMTVGWGHALHVGSHFPAAASRILFDQDYEVALVDLHLWMERYGISNIDPVRRAVLLDMAFNLGLSGLFGFVKFADAFKQEDYRKAAEEMLNSSWARQVGRRSLKLAHMMDTGEWESPRIPRAPVKDEVDPVKEPWP